MSEYYGGLPENDYRDYLEHGKLWDWANHKYLYIDKNGNYVYARDVARSAKKKAAALTPKNINRSIYRKTGVNIGGGIKNAAGGLASAVSGGARSAKNTAATFKPKNVNRTIYKKTGVNVAGSVSDAFSSLGKKAKKTKTKAGYEAYKVAQSTRVKGRKLKKRALSALKNSKLGKMYQAHKNTKMFGGGAI